MHKFRIYDEKYKCWSQEPMLVYPDKPMVLQGRIIQLYTGIDDIKGTSIYEGDIIKHILWDGTDASHRNEYNIGIVVYDKGVFWVKNNSGMFYFDKSPEVIGNIFQLPCNPDHNGECLVCDNWLTHCEFNILINR